MKVIDNKIWLYFHELVNMGMSEDALSKALYRNSLESRKDDRDRRKTLVLLESIPSNSLRKLGDINEIIEKTKCIEIKDNLSASNQDIEFFRNELAARIVGNDNIYKLAQSYAMAKSLIEIYERCKKNSDYSQLLSTGREAALEIILKVAHLGNLAGLTLNSVKSLDKKLSLIRKNGYDVLISQKYGNQNTRKVCEITKAILGEIWAGSKWNDVMIHRALCERLNVAGLPIISLSAVRNYINDSEFQFLYMKERDGTREWQNKFEPIVKRKAPSRAGMLWNIDGTPIEIYMRFQRVDKNGKKIWTVKRLYAVFIMDAYSWKIVGVGVHNGTETRELITSAVKDAIYKEGYRPHQLVYDNTKAIGGELEEWFKQVAHYAFPAAPGNAKAKVIEPGFKHFFETQAKLYKNFSGLGITSKSSDSKVNQEYVRQHLMEFPLEEEAIAQIQQMVRDWNDSVYSAGPVKNRVVNGNRLSPSDAQAKSLEIHRDSLETFSLERKIDLFWVWRTKNDGEKRETYTPTNKGITVKFPNGEKRTFEILQDEMDTIEQYVHTIGKQVHIKYDPTDYSMVAVYMGDRFLTMAVEEELVPMALGDYEEGDGAKLAAKKKKKKDVVQVANEKREENRELAAPIVSAEDILKSGFGGTTSTHHKDRMNDAEEEMKTSIFNFDELYG